MVLSNYRQHKFTKIKALKHFEEKEIAAGRKYVYEFEIDPICDLSFPDAGEKNTSNRAIL